MSGNRNNFNSDVYNASINNSTLSDFSQYLMHERAKSVPVAKYDTNMSMRIWLANFEMQAKVQGITDLNLCGLHIAHYMPILIQQWLPTLAPPILASWELIKEALIARFGVSAEVDNQRLLKDLKRCKKGAQESIRLHATKWEHLLSLISEEYTEDTKINLFIQSLDKPETRLTLIAIQVALKLDTVAKVIQQAIDLEVKARLTEQPETLDNTPMDVDAFQRAHSHHQYSHQNKANGKPRNKSYEQVPRSSNKYVQLRAYDKFGNPICDICHNKHRTVDCNQYRSNKSSSNKPVYNKNKKYNQQNQHCCKHSYFLYDISCIKINDDTQKD